jgi:lysophospholipase L1-like esterase
MRGSLWYHSRPSTSFGPGGPAPSPFNNPVIAHGDSFSAGQGAVSTGGFVARTVLNLGNTVTNRAVGGSQTNNGAARMFNANDILVNNSLSLIEFGFNDSRFSPNTEASKTSVFPILAAMAVNACLTPGLKTTGIAGTRTGFGFLNNPYPGAATSNTAGDTWTGTFNGPIAYLCLAVSNSNGSRVTISVDGVSQGFIDTWNPASPASESGGDAPILIRLTGFSAGAHTLVVTVGGQNAGSTAANVGVVWLAGVPSVGPQAIIISPPVDNSNPVNRPDWVQAEIDIAAVLRNDGLNVKLSRFDNLPVVAPGNFDPDTIHFSDSGYIIAANRLTTDALGAFPVLSLPGVSQRNRLFPQLQTAMASTNLSINSPVDSTAFLPGTPAGIGGRFEFFVDFTPTVAGFVDAVRFYKPNDGIATRVVRVWSSAGVQLASASSGTESVTTGWVQVNLPSPVAIAAGQNFFVSTEGGNAQRIDAAFPAVIDSRLGSSRLGHFNTTVGGFLNTTNGGIWRLQDVVFRIT